MITILIFFIVFAGLGANWWRRGHQFNVLLDNVGGRRLLSRGPLSLETDACVVDVVGSRWRVEVLRVTLGRRLVITLDPGLHITSAFKTGFAEIDRNFGIATDDAGLAAAVFGDVAVRDAAMGLRAACRLVRVDLTAGETLVVLLNEPRRRDQKAALDAIVAFANALNAVADVKPQVAPASLLPGGVGGASGSPFALPGAR